ncbi:methyltransferase domain-containing protein [Stratiformator vulcanicus]|uniref:Arsenite methyltransferase n=1 Tax=Stratiformator vulcanicus TaxID=2527980 RepID=A0A517R499_9PLAN|nr:methyltransferase domain-containing protein [Stratiformator vulcanicus]QDT38696.1 arsenite S-adenosylmethyltransferase [Stratiformator vulcanicus]
MATVSSKGLQVLTEDDSVRQRYSAAATQREEALCCPVEYDRSLLEIIPDEIIERDYGCGDPSPFLKPGDTVVDLGSGGGKLCYIAAQVVGESGRVIGVDCNCEMLGLARQYRGEMADKLGFSNVDFRNGRIQDLAIDLEELAESLSDVDVSTVDGILEARRIEDRIRREEPMIADDSVDCVVSNCVLNLVRPADRRQLFAEIFRVLKRGGKAAISDIVSDEDVPEQMRNDPELWSGCISGAWREDQFLKEFEAAGFHGIAIEKREEKPWRTVNGIEFRSVTVVAYKGKQGPCLDRNQAMIYRGPFQHVTDDDGHTYYRGERMAVCDKTFRLLQQGPYEGQFLPVEPRHNIPLEQAAEYDCRKNARRHPEETKGKDYDATTEAETEGCDGGACC